MSSGRDFSTAAAAVSLAIWPVAGAAAQPDEPSREEDVLAPGIIAMIDAAIDSGDETTVAKVLAVARKAAPGSEDEIDRRENAWKDVLAARKSVEKAEMLAMRQGAGALENWKGEIEAGASRSTGTASSFGAVGSLDLKREGLLWSHQITVKAEMLRTNGETTAQRFFSAWRPTRMIGEEAYAYSLTQYEHDPFAGFDNRYTLSGGLGYRPVYGESFELGLEGGPAVRWIDYADAPSKSRLAGRASLNLTWKITPTLSLSQKADVYLEGNDGNIFADTSLDTKLIGNLKARFTYNVRYERNPPIGTSSLNTQSRATFVYGF